MAISYVFIYTAPTENFLRPEYKSPENRYLIGFFLLSSTNEPPFRDGNNKVLVFVYVCQM